jgi:hypothetical protein
LETLKRTQENVNSFEKRLKEYCPNVDIEVNYEQEHVDSQNTTNSSTGGAREVARPHRWLDCMDEFADFVQNVDPPRPVQEPVTIALIDDGVDINEQALTDKIIGGRSFCYRNKFQNLSKSYYVTTGGHGTIMASLICRVCPKAKLYVIKLDEDINEQSKRQITAKSAAKVSNSNSSTSFDHIPVVQCCLSAMH